MGNKTLIAVGTGIACLGLFGVYNAIRSYTADPVEKSDLEATGVITSIYADVVEHRLTGIDLTAHYQFDYEFVAADGETYYGTETIEEREAGLLNQGQDIEVQYYSHQPGINAAKGWGVYIPVDNMPKSTPTFRLFFSLGVAGLGGLLIFSTFLGKEDEEPEPARASASQPRPVPQDPTAGAEELEKLERYRKAYLAHQNR